MASDDSESVGAAARIRLAAIWSRHWGATTLILRVTTSGKAASFYNVGYNTYGIAAGPDGAMWFCDSGPNGAIGRITADGKVTGTYSGAGYEPIAITRGPDGAMWFTLANRSGIGRITTR